MSATERLARVLELSEKHFAPDVWQTIACFLTPLNLGIMAGTLALWGGSHFFGIGEIIDVLLLVIGAFTIGWSIVDVARDLYDFADYTINATTDADLEKAAEAFAHAVVLAGVTVIMALLLRKSVKEMPKFRQASVTEAMRPRWRLGLPEVPPDPEAGRIWSRPGIVEDPAYESGQGKTFEFGEVHYSPHGSLTQRALGRIHELGHRFLIPRFIALRTLRVRLNVAGYERLALLRYLEEALVETVAQVGARGLKYLRVRRGITFPVRLGYVTLGQMKREGALIGTIIVANEFFFVEFTPAPPRQDGPAGPIGWPLYSTVPRTPTSPGPADP
jgi:hypothetical protein